MQGAPGIKRYLLRIMRGETLKGVGVSIGSLDSVDWGPVNHVKDAYTYRKWLVKLTFAQKSFVVSIKGTEAASAEEAVHAAAQRATLSYLEAATPLGNLMGFEVTDDTPENRKRLGVDGGEVRIEYQQHKAAA